MDLLLVYHMDHTLGVVEVVNIRVAVEERVVYLLQLLF